MIRPNKINKCLRLSISTIIFRFASSDWIGNAWPRTCRSIVETREAFGGYTFPCQKAIICVAYKTLAFRSLVLSIFVLWAVTGSSDVFRKVLRLNCNFLSYRNAVIDIYFVSQVCRERRQSSSDGSFCHSWERSIS
ncbi:hypothetical protein GALMADRAFT_1159550 [Galerina marginata CBS 339.88]|uniref:Uncharacterized protein n=1 Tax=Galerina marginata (strain CBS 339.88) TaxID=685588 RepID=A0A067S8Y8_GALM3|nr:hypothetical protein GALMADRAFT_1159550 [Galerina marginata CBS 339.88]